MTSVHSLNTLKELERFFKTMYGDQTGYVYSPTKNIETDEWVQNFFEWPTEEHSLIKHVLTKTRALDVYTSPALYSRADAEKISFKGTSYVWVEFDGNAPTKPEGIPEPAIKIQSSIQGHEHWYWKLEGFIEDISVVENITQRLAYFLKADVGCWNANRVLRPPHTTHLESGRTTSILRWGSEVTPISAFTEVPEVPVKIIDSDDIKFIPDALDVISKFAWPDDAWTLFRSQQVKPIEGESGGRSSALTKLCFCCFEMGMSSAEALSILLKADSRWKKFSRRRDQRKLLVNLINYCRAQKAVQKPTEETNGSPVEKYDPFKIYKFGDFMKAQIELEWVIMNLIHKKSVAFIIGPPGVGKTQFTLRLCEHMVKGEQFLHWKPLAPLKLLFVSMEQPHEEVWHTLDQMEFSEHELLNENLLIMPTGHSESLNSKVVQARILEKIEEFKPDGICIDSWGAAVGDDLNSDKIANNIFRFVNIIRDNFDVFFWFVHHPRKEQIGNKKPNKLDDIHGTAVIGRLARLAVGLWPTGSEIEVYCMKNTLNTSFSPFHIKRTPGLDFEIVKNKTSREGSIFGNNSKAVKTDQDLGDLL